MKAAKSAIPTGIGARRALQPQQNTSRGGGGAVAAASKLHKVTKTINRDDRRKLMFKPMAKNSDSATGRVARTGILKGVRTNRRFELMMQSRELANNNWDFHAINYVDHDSIFYFLF